MADIQGFDPTTGADVTVPQEAAATAWKNNKLRLKPGTDVPIKVNGESQLLPAEHVDDALASGEAELDFDPYGSAKAAAAGFARGATLGATDWLATEGLKYVSPDTANKVKQTLQGLRDEHPTASTVGELGGAFAPMLIPGVGEAEIAANAAKEAAAASRALGPAAEVAGLTGATEEAVAGARGVAAAQAARGVTKGSALAKVFRTLNPYEYVAKAGEAVGSTLGAALGGGKIAAVASPLARFAAEGALIGAANVVDEHELGDTDLTGESILAGAESGALWGTGLGVVGTGVGKLVTAGGRVATKLAEAQLGGTPNELKVAIKRFGRGGLGNRMLEEPGYSPFMDADKQYELANNMKEKDGASLDRVVKDADNAYSGVRAGEVRQAVIQSMDRAAEQYAIAGGNPQLIKNTILREVENGLGWHSPPELPPFVPPHTAEDIYEHWWKQSGLSDPSELRRPRRPTEREINALASEYAAKEIAPITEEAVRAETIDAYKTRRAGPDYNPVKALEAKQVEQRAEIAARAKSELTAQYSDRYDKYTTENARHAELREAAMKHVQDQAKDHVIQYERMKAASDANNSGLRTTFEQARLVRQKLDGIIPWNKVHSGSALDNAAVEVKLAARSALEGKIEESLDSAAARSNDPTTYANYLHAKQRYAESSMLANMAARGQARNAGMFGRASRVGGIGMVVGAELAGVVLGHPILGAMAGIGGHLARHYAPKVAAVAMHKAARIAEIKALRDEVLIATRRGVRSGIGQAPGKAYAKVALQNMAPHEIRMNAAQAMAKVLTLNQDQAGLRSRLAALNPAFPVVAPESFGKAEGAYRRQVNWLMQQIPPHILAQYQQEGRVNPRELSDSDSREFMQHYAVVQDPRVATDALANGNLSAAAAKAYAGAWPAINREAVLTYKAMKQRNAETMDFLPNRRKDNISMLLQDGQGASTLKLQSNAVSFMAQPPAPPSGRARKGSQTGLQHSRDTSKGMAISMAANATASQMAESGPPGRRQGARGSAGLGF